MPPSRCPNASPSLHWPPGGSARGTDLGSPSSARRSPQVSENRIALNSLDGIPVATVRRGAPCATGATSRCAQLSFGVPLVGLGADVDVPMNLTMAITSDRGLCGGINTTVAKVTRAVVATTKAMGQAGTTQTCRRRGANNIERTDVLDRARPSFLG